MSPARGPWESPDKLQVVDRFVTALREGPRMLAPGGQIPGDPVTLQGLEFPTVTLCAELNLPTAVAGRISGAQQFEDATLRRVDLSRANLAFSAWNNCRFEEVRFEETRFEHARLLGCTFENCTFAGSNFKGVGITLGRKGKETTFRDCRFDKVVFAGAAVFKTNFCRVEFNACSMKGIRFDEPLLEQVRFMGSYPGLLLRGTVGEPERNRPEIDFSKARLGWLDVDGGIDLSAVVGPADGSLVIFKDRRRIVDDLFRKLADRQPFARTVAATFRKMYGPERISPLSDDQTMFAMSAKRIAECDKTLSKEQVQQILDMLRKVGGEMEALPG